MNAWLQRIGAGWEGGGRCLSRVECRESRARALRDIFGGFWLSTLDSPLSTFFQHACIVSRQVLLLPSEAAMEIDDLLQDYPRTVTLKDGTTAVFRPLAHNDDKGFHEFFNAI